MMDTRAFALIAQCTPALAVLAALAAALWTGVLFSVSWLSGRARWSADGAELGQLAVTLNRRWATPLLCVALLSGLGWVLVTAQPVPLPMMAGAGVGIAVLLALHSSVSTRAYRVAHGSLRATQGEGARRFALVLSLAALSAVLTVQLLSH